MRYIKGGAHVEGAHDVDLRVGEHDARFGDVLDGVFCAAVLSGDAANRAGEVVALQRLHVGHLEQDQIGGREISGIDRTNGEI